MQCRPGCGACCIAPSISSSIPGMLSGKPANVRCIQLDDQGRCKIFGQPDRPVVCGQFKAEVEFCGETSDQALMILSELESQT